MTLPSHWLETTIESVASLFSGYGFPENLQGKTVGKYPFAKVIDISNCVRTAAGRLSKALNYIDDEELGQLRAKPISAGSVVFAKIGEGLRLNRRAIAERAVVVDNNVMAISPNLELLEPEFLFRWMQTVDLSPLSVATTVPSVRRSDIAGLRIPLPSIAEQRRIVAKLDALFARLARARMELDHLSPLADRIRSAALAEIFTGWTETRRLGDLATFVTSGSRGWAKYYSEEGAAFVRVGNVRRGDLRLETSGLQRVNPPYGAEGARTALLPNDILVTITADLGRVGIVPEDLGPAFVNQHVALVRPANGETATWIAWYLCSVEGQKQLLAKDRGVTKAGLGLDDIRNVAIPMAEPAQRERSIKSFKDLFIRANRLEAEAARARALLDRLEVAILTKAFKGELVPQDPNDEPASVLLERIRAQRAEVAPASKPKRGKRLGSAG